MVYKWSFFAGWFTCQVSDGDQKEAAFPRLLRKHLRPYEALGAGGTDCLDGGGGALRVPKISRRDGSSHLAFGQGQVGCTSLVSVRLSRPPALGLRRAPSCGAPITKGSCPRVGSILHDSWRSDLRGRRSAIRMISTGRLRRVFDFSVRGRGAPRESTTVRPLHKALPGQALSEALFRLVDWRFLPPPLVGGLWF